MDILELPGVDLVHDLNKGIPMKDHGCDFVMAAHILQYVDDLQATLKEIYRVCRHKAILCIVAPYAQVLNHLVNPYYKHLFNEHSPRYWTGDSYTTLVPEEYMDPNAEAWPQQKASANPKEDIDFRLVRIEYFYFPEYEGVYDDIELLKLRQTQFNVAYQIMFHLVAVKEPITEQEIKTLESKPMEVPFYTLQQRNSPAFRESEGDQSSAVDDYLMPDDEQEVMEFDLLPEAMYQSAPIKQKNNKASHVTMKKKIISRNKRMTPAKPKKTNYFG